MRVLTLNVWGLAPPLSRDNEHRMQAIGRALGELRPDVAAFQEAWHPPSRAILVEAARRAGLDRIWHHAAGMTGSGLLVATRWPLRRAELHRFAVRGVAEAITEADYLGGKGFVELSIETPAGPLTLFDTHLQAAYVERARDPYVGVRIAQVVQLASRLREVVTPVVLAGDLNFEDTTQEYAVLTGLTGAVDVAAEVGTRAPTLIESNAYRRGGPQRIDYLLRRSGMCRSVEARSLERILADGLEIDGRDAAHSDHAGLIAEFALRDGGRPLLPPDPRALALARDALTEGRREVVERHRGQREIGAAGLLAMAASWGLSSRGPLSRRRLLRRWTLAAGVALGGIGATRLTLAEALRPNELRGFDRALAWLDAIEAPVSAPMQSLEESRPSCARARESDVG